MEAQPNHVQVLREAVGAEKEDHPHVVGYGSHERRSATATIAAIDPGTIELLNNETRPGREACAVTGHLPTAGGEPRRFETERRSVGRSKGVMLPLMSAGHCYTHA